MIEAGTDILHDVGVVLVSAFASVAGTVAVFSARLRVIDVERVKLEQKVASDRAADKELLTEKLGQITRDVGRIAEEGRARFNTQERLQRAILELVANLASKEGADQRRHTTDVLTRFMAEEQEK